MLRSKLHLLVILGVVPVLPACGDDSPIVTDDDGDTDTDSDTFPPVTTTGPTTDPTTNNPSDPTTDGTTTTDSTGTTTGVVTDTDPTTDTDTDTTTGVDTDTTGPGTTTTDTEGTGTTGGELCGNDALDDDEVCDGTALADQTCADEGFDGGDLGCLDDCTAYDTSACVTFACNNDILEGDEVCDGTDTGTATCLTEGFDGGILGCNAECDAVDTTACVAAPDCAEESIGTVVGDSVASGSTVGEDDDFDETCGFGVTVDRVIFWTAPADGLYIFDTFGSGYDTVLSAYGDCTDESVLRCNDDSGSPQSRLSLEVTQGQEVLISVSGFNGATGDWVLNIHPEAGGCCYAHGAPGCEVSECSAAVCTAVPECCEVGWNQYCADVAGVFCEVCTTPDICGNSVTEGDETCDGGDIGDETCISQGFDGGALGCADDCSGYDTSGCFNYEGGCCFANGSPGCTDDDCRNLICDADSFCCGALGGTWDGICAGYAIDNCAICDTADVCGNGIAEDGEACDGGDFGDNSCQSEGFDGGILFGCSDDCQSYDTSACVDFSDGCCYDNGTPGCTDMTCADEVCMADPYCCNVEWDAQCASLATTFCDICNTADVCGNNVAEEGETCDGLDVGTETCADQGHLGGTLTCNGDCTAYDTDACYDSNCCEPSLGLGCDDDECTTTVCNIDDWCCEVEWDAACASIAFENCGELCN